MPHQHKNPHTHALKPLSIEEIAELSEELYSELIELICSLQVFKPLQKAALHDEDHANFSALEMLYGSLLEQCEVLDAKAHELRRAVDPDVFAMAYIKRVVKILDEQKDDVAAHRARTVQ